MQSGPPSGLSAIRWHDDVPYAYQHRTCLDSCAVHAVARGHHPSLARKEIEPWRCRCPPMSARFSTRRTSPHLATLMPDGSPQSAPVWVGVEGDHVLVATGEGPLKAKSTKRDLRVAARSSSDGPIDVSRSWTGSRASTPAGPANPWPVSHTAWPRSDRPVVRPLRESFVNPFRDVVLRVRPEWYTACVT